MIDCISVENMRESDRYTIENKVPGLQLMWRAALGIYRAVQWKGKIAVLAGSGNNGGDGYALACILKECGFDCQVYYLGSRRTADAAYYAEKASAVGVSIEPFVPGTHLLDNAEMIVDCLLGTGFAGEVRTDYKAAIGEINKSDTFVVSADINSGMNGDTGEAVTAVRSDVTVAIGYVKNGMMNPTAAEYMKRLVCVDIGIELVKEENKICFEEEWTEGCYKWPAYLEKHVIVVEE